LRAKENTLHSRRLVLRYLVSKKNVEFEQKEEKVKVLSKLFENLSKKYQNRSGGYTRITIAVCKIIFLFYSWILPQ